MMFYRLIVYSDDLQYIEWEQLFETERYALQEAESWERAGYFAIVMHGGEKIF